MADLLQPGDKAPDFDLPGPDGDIRLADLKGKTVVLYFYPEGRHARLHQRGQGLHRSRRRLPQGGRRGVGVSKDTVAKHAKFRDKYGLDVALGSAADNDTVERYGAWVSKRLYGRELHGHRPVDLCDRRARRHPPGLAKGKGARSRSGGSRRRARPGSRRLGSPVGEIEVIPPTRVNRARVRQFAQPYSLCKTSPLIPTA